MMLRGSRSCSFLFCRLSSTALLAETNTVQKASTKVKPPYSNQKMAPKSQVTFKDVLEKTRLCDTAKLDLDADAFLKVAAKKFEGKFDRPTFIDWNKAMEAVRQAEHHFPIHYFDKEDLEQLKEDSITFNLAKVVSDSFTLKKLVDLGVQLSNWEAKGWLDFALTVDFDRDVAPKIQLLHDLSIPLPTIAHLFSESAELLQLDVADVRVRVDYLTSKNFTPEMIRQIIAGDATWLTFPVAEIDGRLGFFQKTFSLRGAQVRQVAVDLPELITWAGTPGQIRINHFTLKEVCGFSKQECGLILQRWPEAYMANERQLQKMFGLLHNEVGFSHELLMKFPQCLTEDYLPNLPRHLFLKKLGRDQYDPNLPNYVSPSALVTTTDLEFCQKVAKQSVHVFNEFLKSI